MRMRGELTTKTLVEIILAILGLGILLFLYGQLNWTGIINDETCRESIILRGTLPGFIDIKNYVPLKCKTDKICISAGIFSGRCDDSYAGSTGVTTISVKNKEEVEKAIVQEAVRCWSLTGEGKISLFSQYLAQTYGVGTEMVYPSCIVCSRIAFDKQKLEKKGINLGKIDVQKYMETRLMPNKNITYANYFSQEGFAKVKAADNVIFNAARWSNKGETEVKLDVQDITPAQREENNRKFQNAELAVLFSQISAPSHSEAFKNLLGAAGLTFGASLLVAPVKTYQASAAAIAAWPYTLAIGGIAIGVQQGSVAYNRAITAGYCGDVSTGQEARSGCSVVRVVNYDSDNIKSYCGAIESIS